MKSKRCPIILLCAFVSKEKKSVCTVQEKKRKGRDVFLFFFFWKFFPFERKRKKRKGRTEGKEGKERKGKEGGSQIKSWHHHHQDARDERVILNDSFFLGRTRDDAEREREHNGRAQIIRQSERAMWSIAGLTRNASFSTTRFVSWKDWCSNKDSSFVDGSFFGTTRRRATRAATRTRSNGRGRGDARTVAMGADDDVFDALGKRLRKEDEKAMTLPPGRVGLFGVRETLEYLMDSNAFVEKRVAKYGPVFKTAFFFKPTIAFGSKEAVEEFKSFEGSLPADEALPETFRTLHTEYGALKQSGKKHKATRKNFSKVLGREALESYVPDIATRTEEFVNKLKERKAPLFVGKDIKRFALKTLFYLFLGKVPEDDILEEMYLYNAGLLSLGKFDPTFKKGESALEKLTKYVLEYYLEIKKDEVKLNAPEHFFLKQYSEATDEFGNTFSDERVAVTVVLMVWGSYIEAAALMGHSIRILGEKGNAEALRKAKEEAVLLREEEQQTLSTLAQKGKYLLAVSKETLRFHPQTAGGLRVNPVDRKLCGYDIPAGYVLTADPRIAFLDESAFPDAKTFNPSRFLEASKSEDRFFPGGMGQHQCPGINLATTMNVIFLTKFLTTFSSWEPSKGMPKEVPLVHVPIVIIADHYSIDLMQ